MDEAIDSLDAHEVEPTEPLIDYNLACYYSLKGLKHLGDRLSVPCDQHQPTVQGFGRRRARLYLIRTDPGFQSLVSVVV